MRKYLALTNVPFRIRACGESLVGATSVRVPGSQWSVLDPIPVQQRTPRAQYPIVLNAKNIDRTGIIMPRADRVISFDY